MIARGTARLLYLVRHAAVALDLGVPSEQWQLSAEGAAAEELARLHIWDALDAVYSSAEPKAWGTADPMARRFGLPVTIEDDLGELRRGPTTLPGADAYGRVELPPMRVAQTTIIRNTPKVPT